MNTKTSQIPDETLINDKATDLKIDEELSVGLNVPRHHDRYNEKAVNNNEFKKEKGTNVKESS